MEVDSDIRKIAREDINDAVDSVEMDGRAKISLWSPEDLETRSLHLQALAVQRLDSTIHRINRYPVDSVVCFVNTYPLDSDLSGGQRYTSFEQPGPGMRFSKDPKTSRARKHFGALFG